MIKGPQGAWLCRRGPRIKTCVTPSRPAQARDDLSFPPRPRMSLAGGEWIASRQDRITCPDATGQGKTSFRCLITYFPHF